MGPYNFGNPIPPGRKIEIQATLHTQNKRRARLEPDQHVHQRPAADRFSLGWRPRSNPFFQVNPAVINFNQVSSKDQVTDKATISTTRGERVKLTAVKDNVPAGVKVDLNALDADARRQGPRTSSVAVRRSGLHGRPAGLRGPDPQRFPHPGRRESCPTARCPAYESNVTVMARVTGMISYSPQVHPRWA